MSLIDKLRENDKNGYFDKTPTNIMYPTGFPTLDYRNGYYLDVVDDDGEIEKRQIFTGIGAGSFNMIIGRSATAKTTGAIQMAYNIIKPFEEGFIYHADIENSTSYNRVRNITGMKTSDMKKRYILNSEMVFIEDLYETIVSIANEKLENASDYEYNTGYYDEFGNEIIKLIPTVFILDSIPSMAPRASGEKDEMATESHGMRTARATAEFYRSLTPLIRQANIIVIAINHIKTKIEFNAFIKTQAQTMYLNQNEKLPGGDAPIYYSNNIYKFISSTKFTEEKNGFDGFNIMAKLVKSRTNKAGQIANIIYDQQSGFSYARTLLEFLIEHKLVGGRNPHRRLIGYEDIKFSTKSFPKKLAESVELQKAVAEVSRPILHSMLSDGVNDEMKNLDRTELIRSISEEINKEEVHIPVGSHDDLEE